MATLAGRDTAEPVLSHVDIGRLRFAVLDAAGLLDANQIRSGAADQALNDALPALAEGALDLARSTVDRLLADEGLAQPPVILSSDGPNVKALIGQTLLWADHYLVTDWLAMAAATGSDHLSTYRSAVARLLDLRPLVEAGVVVPALTDLAVVMITDHIDSMVDADLADPTYVSWAESQVVIEGPTAREAAFIHVVDDYPHDDWFYLRAHAASQGPEMPRGQLRSPDISSQLLRSFDPDEDYSPWLRTVRRQAVARLTLDLNADLATAWALGADLVTTSPFRARALQRRPASMERHGDFDLSGSVWADVPWLPDASADLLVKIAANDERVEDLRRTMATTLRTVAVSDLPANAQAVADVGGELAAAGTRLGNELRRISLFDVGAPAALATGSVLVAATMAPPVAAGGVMAGLAAGIPGVRNRRLKRKSAAYAFWMARPRRR